MYKYSQRFALLFSLAWLIFAFASFKGYAFWYSGFIFFLWLSIAFLNYRHKTSLWIFKNKPRRFIHFYVTLLILGFLGDYIVGQQIAHAWVYPFYRSWFDWLRLYLIIYPFGGLSILELFVFLGSVFKERLYIIKRPNNNLHLVIDLTNYIADIILIVTILIQPIIYFLKVKSPFNSQILVTVLLLWVAISTIQLIYHFKHGLHWFGVFLLSLFIFILLHEFPNTFSYEWKYLNTSVLDRTIPILNKTIIDIPYWVIIGWYIMILLMYKLWTHIDSVFLTEHSKAIKRR